MDCIQTLSIRTMDSGHHVSEELDATLVFCGVHDIMCCVDGYDGYVIISDFDT